MKSPAVADEVLPESAVESADDEAAGILFPIDDVISALEFQWKSPVVIVQAAAL